VLIQTNNPQQTILQKIIENDYKGLFEEEIQERQNFNYPPFSRLIKLTVRHADKATSQQAADRLAAELTDALGSSRILGPEQPLVERIRNLFLFDIMVKIERDKVNVKAVKAYIQDRINDILTDKGLRQISIVIDVDCL
jgi:primosomal protein N' (replication factor Y)